MVDDKPKPTGWQKLSELLLEEVTGIHPRLHALNAAASLLPRRAAGHARAKLYAAFGFRIGHGTQLHGNPRLNGSRGLFENLVIGPDCSIDTDCSFDLEEHITIGARVTIAPGVMILTSTHELDIREHRAGPIQRNPVVIEDGVWLGPRCIILPGVTVGRGAIVNAAAVVNKDVAANTRVGGAPAVALETLTTA
jgi:maltose O-acetyltransferase